MQSRKMLRATAVWSQIQDDGLNSAGWKKKSEKKGMCKQLYTDSDLLTKIWSGQ